MKIATVCLATIGAALSPCIASAADDSNMSFYGSLRLQLEKAEYADSTDFKDAFSRIGISASRELGDGLKAFAAYEVAVDLDAGEVGNERQGYMGLSGRLGTVQVGRYWSAFYNAVGYAGDQLWVTSAPTYYTVDGDFRIGQSIMYTSPDLSGFQVSLLGQFDDGGNDDEVEQSQIAATYRVSDSLKLGAGYVDDDNSLAGLAFYYNAGRYYLNGAYVDRDDTGHGGDLIGGVSYGKSLYTLGFSTFAHDHEDSNDFDAVILAYQYSLHSQVKLWVEARSWDGSLYGVEDSNTINVWMNYDL